MKKEEIKKIIIIVVCVAVLVTIIMLIKGCDSTKSDLKKIGYSKDEINTIIEKLNDEEITKILNMDYNKNLVNIINEQYYIPYNLDRYLSYANKNENIKDVISIVNVGADSDWYTNTKETNIDEGIKMLVNKFNYLKEDYSPNDIVSISNWYAYDGHSIKKEVYDKYVSMWKAANKEELTLLVNSSYRTFEEQKNEYDKSNDDYAARPGFSEHQTGLALDIVTYDIIGNEFENTDEFKWLQENAHLYGFILRYPKGKEYITGYSYESWHYRYVGKELATKVKESGLTYDEYYAYYCEYKKAC